MSDYPQVYSIRCFDGRGAVYRFNKKVYEGDERDCKGYVLGAFNVTIENDDAFLAEHEQSAETLKEAIEFQIARDGVPK